MTFALMVFACVAAGVLGCLISGSSTVAWFLIVAAAVWEPVNNGHLEGKILWTFAPTHGFTVADIYGLIGFAVATFTLVAPDKAPPADHAPASRRAAGCVLIFGVGLISAYLTG